MQRKTLETLLKVRKLAADAAQRELAKQQQAAADARDAIRAAENRIQTELAAAIDPNADDDVVLAFSAWLPRGRAAVADARRRLEHWETEVELAQARLATTKTDFKSMELMLERKRGEEKIVAEKREMVELLEMAVRKIGIRKRNEREAGDPPQSP